MEGINELELRSVLKNKKSSQDVIATIMRRILDPSLSWEDKRAFWHFLYISQRQGSLIELLVHSLKSKLRIPFDLVIRLTSDKGIKPSALALAAVVKGLRRQNAIPDLVCATGWDALDSRILQLREEFLADKNEEQKHFKKNLIEKYEFLLNQRMNDQASRVLRRLLQLFPEDISLQNLKSTFDEQWARDILASHNADLVADKLERAYIAPSRADQEMLNCFAKFAEHNCIEHKNLALNMAIGFIFVEEYALALEILSTAESSVSTDWLRVELLVLARRFIEALEVLNHLEVKFSNDPESTFAVSYLRAQCLHALGEGGAAIEIMQSIVRIRPDFRSAHALIRDWTEGVDWT